MYYCDLQLNSTDFVYSRSRSKVYISAWYFVDVKEYVIKAQILAGGRGKGVFSNGFKGGVHLTTEYVLLNFIWLTL